MKKIISLLETGVLAGALLPGMALAERMYPQGNDSQINVYVNGTLLQLDQPALIKSDRTLVPFRAVLEALGAQVSWDEEKQTVHAHKGDIEIELPLHAMTAKKNGEAVQLDVPAEQINYRTMVPLRFMSEALGANIGWAGKTSSVFVSTYSQDTIVTMARYVMDIDPNVQEFNKLQVDSTTIYNKFIKEQISFADFKSSTEKIIADMQAAFEKIQAQPVPNDPLSQHIAARNKQILQKTLDMHALRGQMFSEDDTPNKDQLMRVLTLIDELMGDNEAFEQEISSSVKST